MTGDNCIGLYDLHQRNYIMNGVSVTNHRIIRKLKSTLDYDVITSFEWYKHRICQESEH